MLPSTQPSLLVAPILPILPIHTTLAPRSHIFTWPAFFHVLPDIEPFVTPFAAVMSKNAKGWISADRCAEFLLQMTVYLNGSEHMSGAKIVDRGSYHWAPLLVRVLGWTVGTILPRLPFGEEFLFRLHSRRIRQVLSKRTPIGHGAGSGPGNSPSNDSLDAAAMRGKRLLAAGEAEEVTLGQSRL